MLRRVVALQESLERDVPWCPGDRLLMFTDGLSDALPEVNPDSEWRKWMEQLRAPR